MEQIVQGIILWSWPVVEVILIVIVSTRKELKGRAWLMASLIIGIVSVLCWRIPDLLLKFEVIESLSTLYDLFSLPLQIVSLIGNCLLIPYVIKAGSITSQDTIKQKLLSDDKQEALAIGGWLTFPAIGLILGPIIIIVSFIISVGLFEDVVDAGFGGIFVLNLLAEAGMLVFIIYAATRFFGKKSNAPTAMITLYIVQLVASAICLAINLSAEAEMFAAEDAKALAIGLIGAVIWIPYFRVSKRVKRTFVN